MSYEIPKELQYEEKVLFNLSIRQSLWLGTFALLAMIVFLKTPLATEVKATTSTLLILLGFCFAFLNLKEHLSSTIGFMAQARQMGYFDPKMQGFLGIEKIENETVFMKDGSVKGIVQVQPINFHMLSSEHKQAIISAYREFLNSIDFPLQIAVRTVNLSLEDYFDRLEARARKTRSNEIYSQFRGLRSFIEKYIQENGYKNRFFYLVVPGETTMAKIGRKNPVEALKALRVRTDVCQEKLRNCNLFTKRLSNNELVTLLAGYFDCALEAKQGYLSKVTTLKSGSE